MANEETFILVSLEEQKSKELAQVISNDTSRKILEFLGKKEATESEIAKSLNMPISTVHYNVQQIVKAGLAESKEFVYSDKGKEVNIYRVSKKLIIISPTKTSNVRESLKQLFVFALLSLGMAVVVQIVANKWFIKSLTNTKMAGVESQGVMADTVSMASNIPSYGLYFFLGSMFVILVYLFYSILRKNKFDKKI